MIPMTTRVSTNVKAFCFMRTSLSIGQHNCCHVVSAQEAVGGLENCGRFSRKLRGERASLRVGEGSQTKGHCLPRGGSKRLRVNNL